MTNWGRRQEQPPPASTKLLPGFAISLAQKFSASYEHIIGMLAAADTNIFRVNLLTGAMQPAYFDIRRNRILVEMIRDNCFDLMGKFPHMTMVGAEMTTHLSRSPQDADKWVEVRLAFRAADGREWFGGIADYYPPRETPPRPKVLKGPPPEAAGRLTPGVAEDDAADRPVEETTGTLESGLLHVVTNRDASRILAALRALARGVAAGNPACQPTALLPIRSLSRDLRTHWRFCRHLLTLCVAQVKQDRGAGPAEDAFKLEILRKTIALLDVRISRSGNVWYSELRNLHVSIESSFPPGSRRVWVHATRRTIPGRELHLAELSLDALRPDPFVDDYWLACVYSACQPDLRLRFTRVFAERIHHIADFWRRTWQMPER